MESRHHQNRFEMTQAWVRCQYPSFRLRDSPGRLLHDQLVEKVAVRHHFSGTQRGAMGSYLPTGRTIRAEYIESIVFGMADSLRHGLSGTTSQA
jgi:hypothetical protein